MDNSAQAQKPQVPPVQKAPISQPTQKYVANTPSQNKPKGRGFSLALLILLLVILLIIIGGVFYYLLSNKTSNTQNTNKGLGSNVITNEPDLDKRLKLHKISTSPTPTPTLAPLLQGPQAYKVGELENGINISEVWFSTIDPSQGYQQIKVSVSDTPNKVVSVTAEVKTDKLDNSYPLTLSSGDGSSGDWSGQWTLKGDTYNKNFQIMLILKDSANNTSTTIITIR